ncbi:MAG: periplasmic heavy metal sensor [Peptococcaceae bacterium]|nr:periplasmic heavy metal sensor [Peptococcaceae bacterium]
MRRKVLLLTLTLALVLGIAQIASATGWGMGGPSPALSSGNWTSLVERLNLSDEQAQQLKALHKSNYEATKELRINLQEAMFELEQLGFETDTDETVVEAKITEINDLRDQIYQLEQEYRENMQDILTTEQQYMMMGGHGRHGGRGMGRF